MKHILIVEDEEILLRALNLFMKRKGHQPVACRTRDEMRQQWEQHSFDVVICDMNIPGGGGIDMLQQIVAEGPNITCIAVSGDYPEARCEELIATHTHVHYCQKPFDLQELLALVEQ